MDTLREEECPIYWPLKVALLILWSE